MSENYDKQNILTTIKNILILIYIHLMQIYVKCPNETEDLSEFKNSWRSFSNLQSMFIILINLI